MVTWDEAKRRSNLAKHGMDLADAKHFDFEHAIIEEDRDTKGEQRFRATGWMGDRLVYLVYTDRGEKCMQSVFGRSRRRSVGTMKKDYRQVFTKEELEYLERGMAEARNKARRLPEPTDEENAAIVAAAESDPDALPLTDEQLARMRPAYMVHPEFIAKLIRRKRGRPPIETPKKQVTLRLDQDVIEHYRAGGPGWQSRINEALRKAAGK